jgi:hypothetical protein
MLTLYNKIKNFTDTLKWIETTYPELGDRFPFNLYALRVLSGQCSEQVFRTLLESKLPDKSMSAARTSKEQEEKDPSRPALDIRYVKRVVNIIPNRIKHMDLMEPYLSKLPDNLVADIQEFVETGNTDYIDDEKFQLILTWLAETANPTGKKTMELSKVLLRVVKWNDKAKLKSQNPQIKSQSESQKESQKKSGRKQIVALPIVAEDKTRV